MKPTRVHWYQGDATPVRVKTDWNTSWTRYYNSTGDRSHYSMPFSLATGLITVDEIQEKFNELFGPTGTKRSLLGASNGRAYLTFERAPVSFNS